MAETKIYKNNKGHQAVVLGDDSELSKVHKNRYVKIRFIESGFTRSVEASKLHTGQFKDYGSPSVCGVGISFPGASKNFPRLYDTWKHMLYRCFNHDDKNFPDYGGRGVTVSDDWIYFAIFLEDVKSLENYELFLQDRSFTLDKDFRGTNGLLYSKETCRFSSKIEQANAKRNTRPVEAVEMVSGEILSLPSLAECSRQTGISKSRIHTSIKKAQTCDNYRFSYIKATPESMKNIHTPPNITAFNHTHIYTG